MAKSLGIDYGKKRVGIAISDTSQIIATALCTIDTTDIFIFLNDLIKKEAIYCVVVGEPKNLDGSPTDSTQLTADFVAELTKRYPHIPIKNIDERFTSKMAFNTMIDSGLGKKKRQNKALVDEVSATIILQNFLYYKS